MLQNAGTLAITAGSNLINGTGTTFTKDAVVGGYLYIYMIAQIFRVLQIVSDTQILTFQNAPGSGGNVLSNLVYCFPGDFSPVLGLPLPTPHQLSVQTQALNRALAILDREIPAAY